MENNIQVITWRLLDDQLDAGNDIDRLPALPHVSLALNS